MIPAFLAAWCPLCSWRTMRTSARDGSVSARYAHVTPGIRKRLMLGLTEQWETALDARLAMNPTSPVRVLSDLLRARRE